MEKQAADGTIFAIFSGANGNYVAKEDENGFHRGQDGREWWSAKRCRMELDSAVSRYNRDYESYSTQAEPPAEFLVIDPETGGVLCEYPTKKEALSDGWNPSWIMPI